MAPIDTTSVQKRQMLQGGDFWGYQGRASITSLPSSAESETSRRCECELLGNKIVPRDDHFSQAPGEEMCHNIHLIVLSLKYHTKGIVVWYLTLTLYSGNEPTDVWVKLLFIFLTANFKSVVWPDQKSNPGPRRYRAKYLSLIYRGW